MKNNICEICGNKYSIADRTFYYRIKKNYPNICKKCSKKIGTKKMIRSLKIYNKNLSKEEKKARNKKTSIVLQNRTPEAKAISSKKMSIAQHNRSISYQNEIKQKIKNTKNNKSQEEKELIRQKQSISQKKRYERETIEERIKRIETHKNGWVNKDNEYRKDHGAKIIVGLNNRSIEDQIITNQKKKNHYKNLSKEERIKLSISRSINIQNYWDNLIKEEYQNQCIQSAINHNKTLTNQPDAKSICEIYFANDLNNLNIDYECNYQNTKINLEKFNKLFPYNPITNTDRINPYHHWDFIIYTKNGNMLVDVDGSQHNIRNSSLISKNVEFNDSQRYLQTDGLDSYIIQCYNNKIDNDTPVYNINNNVYLYYYELLNHIQVMNKEDKCINY